jgi:hypothetical protein
MFEVAQYALACKPMGIMRFMHKFVDFVYIKGQIRSCKGKILHASDNILVEADILKRTSICRIKMTIIRSHGTVARFGCVHVTSFK